MATYSFDTITADQALALDGLGQLTFTSGSATQASVLFDPAGVTIQLAGRALLFGDAVAHSLAASTLSFPDGSKLVIGTVVADMLDVTSLPMASDALFGGQGDDDIRSGAGNDLLQGNQGADTLSGGAGHDTIFGGQGNDRIFTGAGGDFAQGNLGNDLIGGGVGDDTLLGGQGNDTIDAGTTGNDFLNGNLGDDSLLGGMGTDHLFGEDGNDTLTGAQEEPGETIDGGAGNDLIFSGSGSDSLIGGDGNDDIRVHGYGPTTIDAGTGNDSIQAIQGTALLGSGNDVYYDSGRSFVDGGSGNDTINAGAGDTIAAGDGNDYVNAGARTSVDGGAGDDVIVADFGGSSTLSGSDGTDLIVVDAAGTDILYGGAGSDYFRLYPLPSTLDPTKMDRIMDWSAEDHIQYYGRQTFELKQGSAETFTAAVTTANGLLTGNPQATVAIQVQGDVYVFWHYASPTPVADDAIMLVGRSLADIHLSNFTT